MILHPPIPVLRIFNAPLGKAFYVSWLGFSVDWEGRTGTDGPRYIQISRGPAVLRLSERVGGGPNAVIPGVPLRAQRTSPRTRSGAGIQIFSIPISRFRVPLRGPGMTS
jgi:Glyoxalase superfamily protein